jgi:hypothetical protein
MTTVLRNLEGKRVDPKLIAEMAERLPLYWGKSKGFCGGLKIRLPLLFDQNAELREEYKKMADKRSRDAYALLEKFANRI